MFSWKACTVFYYPYVWASCPGGGTSLPSGVK